MALLMHKGSRSLATSLRSGLAVAAIAMISAACSLLVEQGRCSTNADCESRAAGAICSSGSCVMSAVTSNDDAGTPEAAASAECATTSECIAKLGEYAICEKTRHACVKLVSTDCTRVHGDYQNDTAIFVGTLFKQGDTAGELGASPDAIAAIELAFDELKNAHGGLPSPGEGPSRPLVTVECNQTQDAVRAAKHLTDVVRVPAIIGAATSYVTIQAATQATVQGGVFLISPYASSPGLSTLDDDGLVWRTYPSDAFQAAAVPKLVDEIVASSSFKAPRAGRPNQTVRVGIVYKDDTYGQGLRDIILEKLEFNGKNAARNLSDGTLKLFNYPNTDDPTYANYDFTQVAAQVISEAEPFDIVMTLGTSEVISVFSYAESHWNGDAPPHYIMPDSVASVPKLSMAIDNIVNGGTTDSKSLRRRIRGTIVNSFSGPIFDAFSLRFRGDPINGSNAYDAAYVVAYGLYAVGDQPLTGRNLASAMAKLQGPGKNIEVGPTRIGEALQALGSGAITMTGTAGKLTYDLATGDVVATSAAVWCLGVDANGKARVVTQIGQTYSLVDDKLTGTFPDGPTGPDPCGFR